MKYQDFKTLNESVNDKGAYKALFVIGSAGAGKSYTIKNLHGVVSPKIINTDRFLEFYANKIGVKSTSKNWLELFHDKTTQTTKTMAFNYINAMLPLFVDSTSNDVSSILSRAAVLESVGYDVGYIFVNADIETVLKRVQKRNDDGNREVDLDYVKKAHEKAQDDINFLKNKGSFFHEINNSEGELNDSIMQEAFKKAQSFFSNPLENPIGKRNIKALTDSGEKYLIPEVYSDDDLKKKVERWYK